MKSHHEDDIVTDGSLVPGTEILFEGETQVVKGELFETHLQSTRVGSSNVLLVPQPSLTDPNDPLRWPLWKKYLALFNGVWYSFNGSMTGPIMTAGMIPLSLQFNSSLQRLSYANGATLVTQGVATVIWMPFAVKYGRRPVYLASNLLMGLACVWLGLASTQNYTVFLLGRVFLGIFEAPIESITPSTVTDLFFLHERGKYVSIYGLSVLSGNALGPLISAFIIQSLGMRWAFYIIAMFVGASLISMFFGMPETKYTGPRPTSIPSKSIHSNMGEKNESTVTEKCDSSKSSSDARVEPVPTRKYYSDLAFWSKPDPNVNLTRVLCRPLTLVLYPTVLWSSLVYGLSLSWNVVLGATAAQLFAPPPYNFNSSAQGLIFVSPFIGSLIGTYLCGPFADAVANYYTKRNNGIREPEMRLPTCAIAAIITTIGVIIAAVTYHFHTHWAGPVVGFGVLSVGAQMGATLAMVYSLDCHRELSAELMVTVSALKSLIAWIWTWVINDWIDAQGMLPVFCIIGAINVAIYATTFVLYIYGKRIRRWIHETNMLARFNLT